MFGGLNGFMALIALGFGLVVVKFLESGLAFNLHRLAELPR